MTAEKNLFDQLRKGLERIKKIEKHDPMSCINLG